MIDRRLFVAAGAVAWLGPSLPVTAAPRREEGGLADFFPHQDPQLVQQVVGKSHVDLAAVEKLVTARPALAKAAWDWGFGDWETALGAASHTGRREIAELLMAHGARPDLFTFAMLDQVDAVRAICAANPGIQRTPGPHGISLLDHARSGEAASVIAYLEELGDADGGQECLSFAEDTAPTYMGDYVPSEAADTVFRVGLHARRKLLTFGRDDGPVRLLMGVGEHTFAPAGAAAVRIAFQVENGRARGLTVRDGDVEVDARRS